MQQNPTSLVTLKNLNLRVCSVVFCYLKKEKITARPVNYVNASI